MDQQQQHLPRSPASHTRAAGPTPEAPGPAVDNAATGESSGGLGGWLSGAAGWLSEKARSAGAAIGDVVEDSRRTLGDTWEAIRGTDVDWSRDAIRVETDLDEVLDVLPTTLREQLDLDRQGAENRASLTLNRRDGSMRIEAADLRLRGLQAGGLQTGAVSLRGVQIDLRNPDGGLPFLDGGFRIPLLYQDKTDNLDVQVKVEQVDASDIRLAGVGQARQVRLTQLQATAATQGGAPFQSQGPTLASFSVEEGVISGLQVGDVRADQLQVRQAQGVLDEASGRTTLQAGALGVAGGQQGERRLGAASASGVQADLGAQERSLRISAASLQDFSDPALGRVGGASLSDLSVSHSEQALLAQLGGLDAGAVSFQSSALHGSANQLSARQLQLSSAADQTQVQADSLGAEALRFRLAKTPQQAAPTDTPSAGAAQPALDTAALSRSLLSRVDSADIAGSARLLPGELQAGSTALEVQPDTTVSGRLRVDQNRITPGQTSVQLSRPMEGPLWTSLHGAYVDDKGRLKADVGGWFDQDVTSSLHGALGMKGDRLASLSAYGEALGHTLSAPRAEVGDGSSQGGRGGGGGLDPGSVALAGRVGLSAGEIDAGAVGGARLDAPADVSLRVNAGEAMVASFARLLVSALRVDLGSQKASAGGAQLMGGAMTASPDAVEGVVQTIRLEEVGYTGPGMGTEKDKGAR